MKSKKYLCLLLSILFFVNCHAIEEEYPSLEKEIAEIVQALENNPHFLHANKETKIIFAMACCSFICLVAALALQKQKEREKITS